VLQKREFLILVFLEMTQKNVNQYRIILKMYEIMLRATTLCSDSMKLNVIVGEIVFENTVKRRNGGWPAVG